MHIQDLWEKAARETKIIRPRLKSLSVSSVTELPYTLLSESMVNRGDTVVRKGKISVDKPTLLVPPNIPHFEGFDFENELKLNQDTVINFLLVRGIKFPSFKYSHEVSSLDLFEGHIKKAIGKFSDELARKEDVDRGLITGPDDCWPFSILIFVCTQVIRSAPNDIRRLFDDYMNR
jgi:hypothetical protein